MSEKLIPARPPRHLDELDAQSWQESRPSLPAVTTSPIRRAIAALLRYKWLMLGIMVASVGAGVAATRFVTPLYEVRASIMIAPEGPMESRTGPIRSSGLLSADDWNNLLKSFAVTDAVVRKLTLYLRPANYAQDGDLFKGFALADRFAPGNYQLVIDQSKKRWTLLSMPSAVTVDSGLAIDSVGRQRGFLWMPPSWVFSSTGTRNVKFTVLTPREVSAQLVDRLVAQRREQSNFLRLTLLDPDPKLAAAIMNTWIDQFVDVAAQLKRRKLSDFARTLGAQLQTAKGSLDGSEIQLSSFRVNTITQPSEGGPIAAGVQETRDPVIRAYFDKKIEYDDIRHDVIALQTLLANAKDSLPTETLLQIRSISSANAASGQELRNVIAEYHLVEQNLAQARIAYTEEHPVVRTLVARVNTLRREKIPQYARALLMSMQTRAAADSIRIAGASENLQRIPQRTIEEERLRRMRDISSGLYTNLQNRYAEAQLAEASATPDVTVLDSAIAPIVPTTNTAPRILMMSALAGVGAAIGLALLLDKVDARLRYPSQVGDELGLPIAGAVPHFPKGGVYQSPEQSSQLVESFRSLRMSVMHAVAEDAVSIAVSSPSPSEGKSFVAANLAMSFAEAGYRTVLVDGDTRRGALHELFGFVSGPGLTEYLSASATLEQVLRATPEGPLSVITCGARMRRSPELLTSVRLPGLVSSLGSMFDIVIFDTPPLAAGIDGYSIAAATGSLLMVLRVGQTRRRMALEKLRVMERLPVFIVGAVLNDVELDGEYAYYSYAGGYEATDPPSGGELARVN